MPEVRKESSAQVIFEALVSAWYCNGGLSSIKIYVVIYCVQIGLLMSNSPANYLRTSKIWSSRKFLKLFSWRSFWIFFTLTENFELFQLCPKQGKDETTREAASFISGVLLYLSNISALIFFLKVIIK